MGKAIEFYSKNYAKKKYAKSGSEISALKSTIIITL